MRPPAQLVDLSRSTDVRGHAEGGHPSHGCPRCDIYSVTVRTSLCWEACTFLEATDLWTRQDGRWNSTTILCARRMTSISTDPHPCACLWATLSSVSAFQSVPFQLLAWAPAQRSEVAFPEDAGDRMSHLTDLTSYVQSTVDRRERLEDVAAENQANAQSRERAPALNGHCASSQSAKSRLKLFLHNFVAQTHSS